MFDPKSWTSTICRSSLNLLFPPVCTGCQGTIAGEDEILLCTSCRTAFTRKPAKCCPRCGDWNLTTSRAGSRCKSCARHKVHFEQTSYLGAYEQDLRHAVLQLKHPGQESLALALGELSVHELSASVGSWSPDLVVPVPMHWRRRLSHGGNSPELLGDVWSRRLKVPLARNLLIRQRNTVPQADLLPAERFRNVRGAFRVSLNYRLRGAKILLVDDILTTGATCHEAALTLCRNGAKSVYVVALARAG